MYDQVWLTHRFGSLIAQVDPRPPALAGVPDSIVLDDNDHAFIFLPRYG